MPKHNTYQQDENISENDILLGSDADDSLKTKNFRVGKLKDFLLSFVETIVGPQGEIGPQGPQGESANVNYKIYRALITQTGTNNPTIIVLENTLGGDIVWTRTSQGFYKGTLANAFDDNKTFYYINSKKYLEDVTFSMEIINIDDILLYSFNNEGTVGYDSYLYKTPIEIIVYN